MGIGTGLAFIALGAILAFAFHVHVSGLDINMVGWILILIGILMLLITLIYTRPRKRRAPVNVVEGQPGAYVADVDDAPIMNNPAPPVQQQPPVQQPPVQQQQQPIQPDPRQRPR